MAAYAAGFGVPADARSAGGGRRQGHAGQRLLHPRALPGAQRLDVHPRRHLGLPPVAGGVGLPQDPGPRLRLLLRLRALRPDAARADRPGAGGVQDHHLSERVAAGGGRGGRPRHRAADGAGASRLRGCARRSRTTRCARRLDEIAQHQPHRGDGALDRGPRVPRSAPRAPPHGHGPARAAQRAQRPVLILGRSITRGTTDVGRIYLPVTVAACNNKPQMTDQLKRWPSRQAKGGWPGRKVRSNSSAGSGGEMR